MRVLLTGGAGFIGSHVAEALLARGDHVVCFDNFNDFYSPKIKRANLQQAMAHPGFSLVEADLLDREAVLQSARGCDGIIHLAAYAGVRPSLQNPILYARVNLEGTINVLDAARALREEGTLSNLVFASSSSVYGINTKVPFDEEQYLGRAISPYAASKVAGESICHVYSHAYRVPITCLRFFTVYGPRQRPEMAIHKFTRLMDQGEQIDMYGDGSSTRDYTFCSDVVAAVVAALLRPRPFEVINLGNSRQVALARVIELIRVNLEALKGEPVQPNIRQLPDQQGDVPTTFSDISKAQRLLDYDPKVQEDEGIALFVEWYGRVAREL